MTVRFLCFALLFLGFGARDAVAQVYKCRDSAGNVTYVDRPCPDTEKTEETPPIDRAPTVYPDDNPPPRNRTSGKTTRAATGAPRSVCGNLGDGRTSDESVINCARQQNLPYGRTWAMTQPWKDAGDGVTTAAGYCLTGSDTTIGGKVVRVRASLYFRDDFRNLKHGKKRYYVNGLYVGAIDEGATQMCSMVAKSGG